MITSIKSSVIILLVLIMMVLTLDIQAETHHKAFNKALSSLLVHIHCDDPKLALSIIQVESGFNNVVSKEGSIGLMQVRHSTGEWIGCGENVFPSRRVTTLDLMQQRTNIKCGCSYLKLLSKKYPNKKDVIAAYNAGASRKCQTGTLFPSGQKCLIGKLINQYYVDKVSSIYKGKM